MIGVIAGDVIGSVHEHALTKRTDFALFDPRCRFTDDTVLTVATAYAILNGTPYATAYRDFGREHPNAGYGRSFYEWLLGDELRPYHSWGNGSAMRVAPVGFAFNNVEDVLLEAARSAAVTHNHLEGIKGAQATALAVFMARADASKDEIREEIMQRFGPSGSPCRSAVMPIPKPQSRAALLRRSIDGSLTRSSLASESGCLHDSTK